MDLPGPQGIFLGPGYPEPPYIFWAFVGFAGALWASLSFFGLPCASLAPLASWAKWASLDISGLPPNLVAYAFLGYLETPQASRDRPGIAFLA